MPTQTQPTVEKLIELRPNQKGQLRAYIAGTRVRVQDIYVDSEVHEKSPDEIVASMPHITLAQVHAALAYYFENREAIFKEIKQDESFVAKLRTELGLSKVVLPRTDPDHFWKLIHKHYAKEDQQKWKVLAMLALRENSGWPLEEIGTLFGHSKGHVSRCLEKIKSELRSKFEMSPNVLVDDDDPD